MPNVDREQTFAYSCGASALLCAAIELGVEEFPVNKVWNASGNTTAQPLTCNENCERTIFKVTGAGSDGTALQDRTYSMPDKLIRAAHALHLTEVSAYVDNGVRGQMLTWRYKDAIGDVEKLGVVVHRAEMPQLADNQRALMAVFVPPVGLHWILHRPDGTYMDPARGKSYGSFAEMRGVLSYYIDTGTALVLSR